MSFSYQNIHLYTQNIHLYNIYLFRKIVPNSFYSHSHSIILYLPISVDFRMHNVPCEQGPHYSLLVRGIFTVYLDGGFHNDVIKRNPVCLTDAFIAEFFNIVENMQ